MERPQLAGRLADLAVAFAANVQPGQVVQVNAECGQEAVARAVAEAAYARGATFVDVAYLDPYVKRSRIVHADDSTLEFVPRWHVDRVLARRDERCAVVSLAGTAAPGLLADLDPSRAARVARPLVPTVMEVVNSRASNWTVVPAPNAGWAKQVHAALDEERALDRLWDEIASVCRLDEPDPVAAWRQRTQETGRAARNLTEAGFDAIHLAGAGTDVTIGLLRTTAWQNAELTTLEGVRHLANLPSEEVAATPDPERADGVVHATKPLVLGDGTLIEGLELEFERGRAVEIRAESGAEALRARCAADEGAARLGEVALVDGEGRVGRVGTVFFNTLLDENAASHLALGAGYTIGVGEEDAPRVNRSQIHIDFMVGGDDVDATGITRGGERIPILRGGAWRI